MKIVVGIGNPGTGYARTRHNIGFRVLDEVALRADARCSKRRFRGKLGQMKVGGEQVLLLKPQTYVNESGLSVAAAVRWYDCGLPDVLVVCDDFELPLGVIRIRRSGSAGGHNGLASVIQWLGGEGFPRMRLGIGGEGVSYGRQFVLSPFRAEEKETAEEMVSRAADAVSVWMRDGIERCMNEFNGKPVTQTAGKPAPHALDKPRLRGARDTTTQEERI